MNDLPPGWVPTTIGAVTVPVQKHRPEGLPDVPFQYIDIASVDNRHNVLTEPKCLLGTDAPSRARQLVRTGDTLLSTVRTYLRNTAQVPASLDGATASTGFCVLRPVSGLAAQFLFYRTLEGDFVNDLSARQTGTSYPAVRDADVRDMRIAMPPFAEQHRIVQAIEEQFSRLDAGVASLQRAKRNLTRMRASVLAAAVEGRLVEPEGEKATVAIGDICEVQGGIQKQPKRAPKENAYPFLRVANVLRGRLELDEVHRIELFGSEVERLRLRTGDLLVVEGNGSPSQIGRGAMWHGEIEDCVHQNHIIRVRPSDALIPQFLAFAWNSSKIASQLTEVASSTSGLYTLSTAKIKAIRIDVPSTGEQQRIVAEVERQFSILDAMDTTVSAGLARAERLRQSILREAFAGRLVRQDPADEPASVLLERIELERATT